MGDGAAMEAKTETLYVPIRMKETGERIRDLMDESSYTVRDLQTAVGLASPQAVYHWLNGRSLPSVDHLMVLCRLFHVKAEDILVMEDVAEEQLQYSLESLRRCRFYYKKLVVLKSYV